MLRFRNILNVKIKDGNATIAANPAMTADEFKYNLKNFYDSWNTLITRSQVGSVIIDNSKEKILSSLFSIKLESNQAFVPSKEPEIAKMKEAKMKLFEAIKTEPYSYKRIPATSSASPAVPSNSATTTTPATTPSTTTATTTAPSTTSDTTTETKTTTADTNAPSSDTTATPDDKSTAASDEVVPPAAPSFSKDDLDFLLNEEVKDPIPSINEANANSEDMAKIASSILADPNEDVESGNQDGSLSNEVAKATGKTTFHMARTYTNVTRQGCNINKSESNGNVTYTVSEGSGDNIISDLFLFLDPDKSYTQDEYENKIKALKELQFYISYMRIYKKEVTLPESLMSYKEIINKGKLVIKVDRNISDKSNYDASEE